VADGATEAALMVLGEMRRCGAKPGPADVSALVRAAARAARAEGAEARFWGEEVSDVAPRAGPDAAQTCLEVAQRALSIAALASPGQVCELRPRASCVRCKRPALRAPWIF
jgi:hypothetical protein